MKSNRIALSIVVLALIAVAALLAPEARAANASLRVRLSEPVIVNGELHGPGVVTLKHVGDFTPTATLNELWVGKHCLGVMLAREMPGRRASDDSLVFHRDEQGNLILVGMAFRGQPERELYGYVRDDGNGRWVEPPVPEYLMEPERVLVASR